MGGSRRGTPRPPLRAHTLRLSSAPIPQLFSQPKPSSSLPPASPPPLSRTNANRNDAAKGAAPQDGPARGRAARRLRRPLGAPGLPRRQRQHGGARHGRGRARRAGVRGGPGGPFCHAGACLFVWRVLYASCVRCAVPAAPAQGWLGELRPAFKLVPPRARPFPLCHTHNRSRATSRSPRRRSPAGRRTAGAAPRRRRPRRPPRACARSRRRRTP